MPRIFDNIDECRSPEDQWPDLQDDVIGAMDRLEKALRPHLRTLKLSE
jgi:hypothetical protein